MATKQRIDGTLHGLMMVFTDPVRRRSLLLEISHSEAVEALKRAGSQGKTMSLWTTLLGESARVRGEVELIIRYNDGHVICLVPDEGSICSIWPIVPVWVPIEFGPTGVICLWETNSGLGCPFMPDVFAKPAADATCPEPLRAAHHPSGWDDRTWLKMRRLPWMLVHGDDPSSETEVILRAGTSSLNTSPTLEEIILMRFAGQVEGRVDLTQEYRRFLARLYEPKPNWTTSLLAGMYASGRRVYEFFPKTPQRSGIYRYEAIVETAIDWHAYFVGYGVGQGIWGDIARQCHNLAYHRARTPEEVFHEWIPTFARAVYHNGRWEQGRSTLTFAEFALAKTKNVL